jgi:hypothetical protein
VVAEPVRPVTRNPLWKRQLATASRWVHVYLSMVSFAILLFFAVTGLTLNHAEWFGDMQRTVQVKGVIDPKLSKLDIVEFLRAHHNVKGAMSDFRTDDAQFTVAFRGPGYSADTIIDRDTGKYTLTEVRAGAVAVLNDLHKGRDTGPGWSWMIDASAILMTIVSISGLTLIFFLPKRRFAGLLLTAAGIVVCLAVYKIWVP